jgi:hypothetical protein
MRFPSRASCTSIAAAALAWNAGCGAPREAGVPTESTIVLGEGVTVDRAAHEVRVKAEVACDRGFLEQAVCKSGTREHESLLAVDVPPSRIHAAILLLGLEPGHPGEWRQAADGAVTRTPPIGARLELTVRAPAGEVPLSRWVHDPLHGHAFPEQPWLFAGSRMVPNPRGAPGERYLADASGSVAGIVTFGDETIAFCEVISDQTAVDSPEWQANTAAMPPAGTPVVLVIRPAAPAAGTPGGPK